MNGVSLCKLAMSRGAHVHYTDRSVLSMQVDKNIFTSISTQLKVRRK